MPACSIRPSASRLTLAATPTVAKSPARRSSLRYAPLRPRGPARRMRISVRTSVGSIAVWNVSMKKSRAAMTRSPLVLATDDRAFDGEERRRPVRGWVGMGARATDRAPVADLRIADAARHVVEQRVPGHDVRVLVDLAVRRPSHRSGARRRSRRCRRGLPTSRRSTRSAGLREAQLEQRDEAVAAGRGASPRPRAR